MAYITPPIIADPRSVKKIGTGTWTQFLACLGYPDSRAA